MLTCMTDHAGELPPPPPLTPAHFTELHPHTWVRLSASRLFGAHFASYHVDDMARGGETPKLVTKKRKDVATDSMLTSETCRDSPPRSTILFLPLVITVSPICPFPDLPGLLGAQLRLDESITELWWYM